MRLNPTGTRAWADGVQCVWEAHGVYALPPKGSAAEPSLLVPDYFSKKPDGTPVHFASDYMVPLWEKVSVSGVCACRGGGRGGGGRQGMIE